MEILQKNIEQENKLDFKLNGKEKRSTETRKTRQIYKKGNKQD